MKDWLAAAERIPIEGCTGPGSYIDDVPWRLVLHTIEGGMQAAIDGVFKPKPCYCPHLTVSLSQRRIAQHVRFSWASAALANDPGGAETNRWHAIQIELEGFSAKSTERTPAEIEFLGEVIAMIVGEAGVPINLDHVAQFVGPEAGTIAVKNSRYRMTAAQWRAFDGVCGHQHVPENEHWDPGHLDVQTAVDHAKTILGQPAAPNTPAPEEDIMATRAELQQDLKAEADRIIAAIPKPQPVDDGRWMATFQAEGKVYIVIGGVRYHVPGGATEEETNHRLQLLELQGFDNRGVQDAALSVLPEAPFSIVAA